MNNDWNAERIRALCDHIDKRRGRTILAHKLRIAARTVRRWIAGTSRPRHADHLRITRIARYARFKG